MGSLANFLLILLSIIVNSSAYSNFEYCKDSSWIKYGNNCYLFQSKSQQRVSYYDAEDFCVSQGGHLVSIHSEEENEFILNTMASRFGGRMWIGLNILSGDDKPQWSDGSTVDYQKRVKKDFYKKEKCFMMYLSQRGWRPEHCALHYAPLCKKSENSEPPITTTTVTPPVGHCPENWIQFGQKCYKYFGAEEKDRVQYKQARTACWNLGEEYNLVAIHSMEEQAFLTQHLYHLGTSAWIGINKVESDEIGHDLVFGWVDNSRNDFSYWAKGHPPPGTWKYCGHLRYDGVNKGEWLADYCELNRRGYICQRPSDPSLPPPVPEPSKCKEGFGEYRESCYRFIEAPATKETAQEVCSKLGAKVVSIKDGFEQAFLYNFIPKHSQVVGISLKAVEGTRYFQWADKQPVYYTNWQDGEPRLTAAKSCASMTEATNFKWQAEDCSNKLQFVCEISDETPPKFPEIIGKCPLDQTFLDIGDEFCYHIPESNKFLSWDSASRYCLISALEMVSIHSDHQTKSLIAYTWNETRNVHLGLTRGFGQESFMWVDRTPMNYTNWAKGEPSSWFSDRNCAVFSQADGTWTPISCSEGGITFCRKQKEIKKQ